MKTIISLLFLGFLGWVGYNAWMNRYDLFYSQKEPFKVGELEKEKEKSEQMNPKENKLEPSESEESQVQQAEEYFAPIVTAHDCEKKCETKKDEGFEYCKEFCGLSEEKNSGSECVNLSGLERDSCFKNTAVKEKNDKLCGEISEEKLREVCRDRVLEEIIP